MSAGKSRTRLWFLVHGWMGLPLWALLLFICVTGTLASVSREILWLADPAVRASGTGADLPPNALVAAVESVSAGARVTAILRDESYLAVQVRLARPDGTTASAWVDPATGTVQGYSNGAKFLRFLRALHGWLLVPAINGISVGWYAVSLMALPLLGSLITGLVVYKRFWRAFYQPRLRLNQTARVVWGDVHRLAGVWGLWFVLLMAITGLWFLIQAVIVNSGGALGQGRQSVALAREDLPMLASGQSVPRPDLDQAVRTAQAALPGFTVTRIILPGNAFEPLTLHGDGRVPLLSDTVTVNPFSGTVVTVQLGGDQPPLLLAARIFRPLHVGNFAGLWVKLVWFVFGAMLSAMVLSGMVIWSKRTFRAAVQHCGDVLREQQSHA